MAFRAKSRAGGQTTRGSLKRQGLGDVSTQMSTTGRSPDIFKDVKSAFSMSDLRRAMRGRGGGPQPRAGREDRREARGPRSRSGGYAPKGGREVSERGRAGQMAQSLLASPGAYRGDPFGAQNIQNMIGAIGIPAAQQGLMQSGQLLAGQGGEAVTNPTALAARGQRGMGPNEQRALRQQMLAQGMGPGSSREEGGGVPETGMYQLHEGEEVVPAPEKLQEMVMDMMVDRQMGSKVGTRTKGKRKG